MFHATLLNVKAFDVFVGFGKLAENTSYIDRLVSNNEGASGGIDVAFDVRNAFNFGQIAPDRGGTAHSRHIWQFEDHLLTIRRGRSRRSSTFLATCGCIPLAAQDSGQTCDHRTCYPTVHERTSFIKHTSLHWTGYKHPVTTTLHIFKYS